MRLPSQTTDREIHLGGGMIQLQIQHSNFLWYYRPEVQIQEQASTNIPPSRSGPSSTVCRG